MILALVLTTIAAATLCAAVLLDAEYEFILPPTLFAITLALYVAGIVDMLEAGFWLILATVTATLLWLLLRKRSTTLAALSRAIQSPGVAFFFLFAISAYVVTRDIQLAHYDEFSHWGRMAKATFLYDALGPYNPVDLRFRFYTPGASLFGYFVMRLGGEWVEGHLFWAHQLLYGSLFLPFMTRLRWSAPQRVLLAAIVALAGPQLVFRPLGWTLADPLVGVMAGYLFALVYLCDLRDHRTSISLSLGLSVLVLLKDTAALFALVIVGMYLARLLSLRRAQQPREPWGRSVFGWMLFPVLAAPVTRLSWSAVLRFTDTKPPSTWGGAGRGPSDLLDLVDGTAPAYWGDVATEYVSTLTREPLAFGEGLALTPIAWLALVGALILWLAVVISWKRDTGSEWAPLLVMCAGAVAYLLTLLTLYFLLFSQEEALRVAGWQRYVGTYVAAFTVFISACLTWLISHGDAHGESVPKRGRIGLRSYATNGLVAAWCCMILIALPVPGAATEILDTADQAAEKRAPYDLVAQKIEDAGIGAGDRVTVVLADYGNGYDGWVLRYLLLESKVWVDPDVGSAPEDRDPSRERDFSAAAWQSLLARDFDYVVLFSADDSFKEEYGALFENPDEIRDSSIFEVDDDSGRFQLTSVP